MAATGADLVETDADTGAEGFDCPVVSEEGIGASALSKRAYWSLATQFLWV